MWFNVQRIIFQFRLFQSLIIFCLFQVNILKKNSQSPISNRFYISLGEGYTNL